MVGEDRNNHGRARNKNMKEDMAEGRDIFGVWIRIDGS